ncbi:class I SAM-dependent methyltransferase [Siansivirga zeaxanthinifaciens]|uniref:Methyltransferase domain-containing protein n=1 Tax=Siansivirga zeaxanthinifaciens CC-SAMT-1 TaxID=1454006 RepID=A0A0C5WER1_9FLAO|nr:class I SAM-dependent methyltransferase [Siansivirga zeaxanthinifaciens]AJR04702.1 hypothetical protein AW14_00765 [Siansivirga zeaxanthinifaciens CC-SAMT-1]
MRLITSDDIIDTYIKLHQRGLSFITSKFNFNQLKRAKTAFNHNTIKTSNWWDIPSIKERWNLLVTGNKKLDFIDFTIENYLNEAQNLSMLSLGSGNCETELKFAKHKALKLITCIDISDIPLKKAKEIADLNELDNIEFKVKNVNDFQFPIKKYDIVYFRASLHHFKNIESLVGLQINNSLKENGFLIIDEYVGPNRLQFPKKQITAINQALKIIPKEYRKRFNLNLLKNKVSGSGILRMIIADPSECIESANILPNIHKNYNTIYEANYGGNILMPVLKDIAHHFTYLTEDKELVLNKLYNFEDEYLKNNPSNFVFGIYQKK